MPTDTSEWELILRAEQFAEKSIHHFKRSSGFQVFKRANGVEVVYKNESTLDYSATTYPWWRVIELTYYGKLHR